MAILLALASALSYGTSDYVGGRASRHWPALNVTLAGDLVASVLILAIVPLVESEWPSDPRVWWGVVAGACGSIGVLGLYRALSSGAMTVVAPITGLVAAALPVIVGLALGDQLSPSLAIGVALAVVAVALVGGIVGALHQPLSPGLVVLSIAVGAAFGMLFVAYSQTGDTGLWPLFTARIGSVPLLVAVYLIRRRSGHRALDLATFGPGLIIGTLIALGNGFYLLSTRFGLLAVVAVVVSLYPASTVGMAMAFDGERVTRWQLWGMALAAVAVSLISLG